MNDLEFVRCCLSGDKRSWEQFIDRYSRLIYSCIHSVLRLKGLSQLISWDNIDDLFQDFFLFLARDNCKKLKSFQGKNGCRFSSWLHQVAVNYVLDYVRRYREDVSLDARDEEGGSLADKFAAIGAGASEIAVNKEEMQAFTDCIDKLNNEDKLFLQFYLAQGLSLGELAVVLRISRGAVDMRKSRILGRLRECFMAKGFELDL